nr:MAG TPA: hypothetical protein [Caudoviricetes sp.]
MGFFLLQGFKSRLGYVAYRSSRAPQGCFAIL